MEINRVWAMPNKWTFKIKPIKRLLNKYVGDGKGWIDPFAGMYSPAEFTNDINSKMNAKYHMEALDFVKQLNGNQYNGCLFDPPYSLRQIHEAYRGVGKDTKAVIANNQYYRMARECISPKITPSGYVISFGWNTVGFGNKYGFKKIEILLCCHGSGHYDTIVTVERRMNRRLEG